MVYVLSNTNKKDILLLYKLIQQFYFRIYNHFSYGIASYNILTSSFLRDSNCSSDRWAFSTFYINLHWEAKDSFFLIDFERKLSNLKIRAYLKLWMSCAMKPLIEKTLKSLSHTSSTTFWKS